MKKSLLVPGMLASTLLLAGCAANDDGPQTVPVFETEVGDCFTTDTNHTAAFVVPCEEPHTYEVTEIHAIDGEEFPGGEAIQTIADEVCPEAFLAYTGEPAAASTNWASMVFAPSEGGWNEQGDRSVVCVVTSIDGEPQTGSAKE